MRHGVKVHSLRDALHWFCQAPEDSASPGPPASKFRACGSLDHPGDANIGRPVEQHPVEQDWFACCTPSAGSVTPGSWLTGLHFPTPCSVTSCHRLSLAQQEHGHCGNCQMQHAPCPCPTRSWLVTFTSIPPTGRA